MAKVTFTDKFKDLIARAVTEDLRFDSKFGAETETIQDLVHGATTIRTLKTMGRKIHKKLTDMAGEDPFSDSTSYATSVRNKLEFMRDLLLETINYKRELALAEKNEAKTRKANARRLAILMDAKDQAEIDAIKAMSPEDIAAEIAKLSPAEDAE